jgi:Matrixin
MVPATKDDVSLAGVYKLSLLAAAAIAALTIAPSAAAAKTRAISPIALASSIAERYWDAVPCDGKIKILVAQRSPQILGQDADAWVTFSSSLGANNLAAPASTYRNCAIALGRWRWPTVATMVPDWDMLCMTMTHEFGHLLGHVHVTTPGNVMNPVFTNYNDEPRLCRTDRPAGAGPRP